MVLIAIIALTIGAVIGLRFTAFALIAAIFCVGFVAGVGLYLSDGTIDGPGTKLILLFSTMQLGYLCGATYQASVSLPAPPGARTQITNAGENGF